MSIGDMVQFIYRDLGVGIILDITMSPYSGYPIALIMFPKYKRPQYLDLRDLNKVEKVT